MPELLWASKDDGLHAFELYRHIQQVCKGLVACKEVAAKVVEHAALLMDDGQTDPGVWDPHSNAPVESLLQLLKHGAGRFMELPALLEHMSLLGWSCPRELPSASDNIVDIGDS